MAQRCSRCSHLLEDGGAHIIRWLEQSTLDSDHVKTKQIWKGLKFPQGDRN